MGEYIYVPYKGGQNPLDVLEKAIKHHGRDQAYIVIPSKLLERWRIGEHKKVT